MHFIGSNIYHAASRGQVIGRMVAATMVFSTGIVIIRLLTPMLISVFGVLHGRVCELGWPLHSDSYKLYEKYYVKIKLMKGEGGNCEMR